MVKKLVMIVDDQQETCEAVKTLLENNDFKVISATSGKIALEKLKKIKPDLILIDYLMPEMDGAALCVKLKQDKNLKNIKIALITIMDFREIKDKIKGLGIQDYIRKPFDNEELVERVKHMTEKSSLTK